MINVNQITAQLARMPDQALQQYAQMHKDDPYILSLALSESNRRKQMRERAQMSVPEQPKVVDQALADMAAPMPEDVGIAQLPAGDMEFAAGGIVAFDEGGEVPRFSDGGLNFWRAYLEEESPRIKAERQRRLEEETARSRQEMAQGSEYSPERYGVTTPAALVPGARGAFFQQPTTVIPTSATPAAAAATPGAQPSSRPTPQPGPRPAPPAGTTPAGAGITGLDVEGMTRRALAEADKAESPIAGQLRELSAERVKAKEAEAAGLEDIQKRFDNIFAGRKQRLESRESEITKMGEQNIGIAALAGAAELLGGRRGREGEAFAKALRTGTAQYGAGLDKIRAAQEKIFDARDRLEEVEAQRGELSARELFKARNEVRNTMLSGREDLIKATMEERKIGREAALKIVDNRIRVGITQMEQEGALQRQRIASDATIRAAAMRPSTDDRTMARIVAEYATNPTKLKILEQTDPVMAQMIRAQIQALNVPAVQAQPGAGGARD